MFEEKCCIKLVNEDIWHLLLCTRC